MSSDEKDQAIVVMASMLRLAEHAATAPEMDTQRFLTNMRVPLEDQIHILDSSVIEDFVNDTIAAAEAMFQALKDIYGDLDEDAIAALEAAVDRESSSTGNEGFDNLLQAIEDNDAVVLLGIDAADLEGVLDGSIDLDDIL